MGKCGKRLSHSEQVIDVPMYLLIGETEMPRQPCIDGIHTAPYVGVKAGVEMMHPDASDLDCERFANENDQYVCTFTSNQVSIIAGW